MPGWARPRISVGALDRDGVAARFEAVLSGVIPR